MAEWVLAISKMINASQTNSPVVMVIFDKAAILDS